MEDRITVRKTPELIKLLKPFWNEAREAEIDFRVRLAGIEARMFVATGINGIEFFHRDGSVVGIGNWDRSMELIHDSEMEE